jgi:hypothetical protein
MIWEVRSENEPNQQSEEISIKHSESLLDELRVIQEPLHGILEIL